jgi:MerR family copper efflux transcriptional regulator
MMNIGQAATASGVSAKMIRNYEEVGLPPAPSGPTLGIASTVLPMWRRFVIRHARDLGFSLQTVGQLVGLWHDRGRPSREVKALALQHIQELDKKAKELLAMKAALEHLVHGCKGDDRPECPIIDSLASEMSCETATPTTRTLCRWRANMGTDA